MRKPLVLMFMVFSVVVANSIVLTLDAPDTNISGLAWGNNLLWAVDEVTNYVHSIDPETGTIQSSFYVAHPGGAIFPTGLAYSEAHDLVLVGLWNNSTSGWVYKYTPAGIFSGSVEMCGG